MAIDTTLRFFTFLRNEYAESEITVVDKLIICKKKKTAVHWLVSCDKIYAILMNVRSPILFAWEQIAGKNTHSTRVGAL